jgi:MoaE-MoaD fusion protein
MELEVLFFAAARERVGASEQSVTLPDGASVTDLLDHLVAAHAALRPLLPYLRVAVDEAFVSDLSLPLSGGQVVALIPPVSGGNAEVALSHAPLQADAIEALVAGPDRGALVTFEGRVRDHTGDHSVERLEYEAYETMALKTLLRIRDAAQSRWPSVRAAVHHRLGVLAIGEAAVVVAVSAPHRAPAFEACRFIIEELKKDVPIFKREVRGDGTIWVGLGP